MALPTELVFATVAECDVALETLHRVLREGFADEKLLAWNAIDEVLDRRNELLGEASRMGAQS